MKSKETLNNFVKYCQQNPHQRFWQALRNWSRFSFIFGYKSPPPKTINGGDEIELIRNIQDMEDTYYFEGKDK